MEMKNRHKSQQVIALLLTSILCFGNQTQLVSPAARLA